MSSYYLVLQMRKRWFTELAQGHTLERWPETRAADPKVWARHHFTQPPQRPPSQGHKNERHKTAAGQARPLSFPQARLGVGGRGYFLRKAGEPRTRRTCPAKPSGRRPGPSGALRPAAPGARRRPRICQARPAARRLRRWRPERNPGRPRPHGALQRAVRGGPAPTPHASDPLSVAAASPHRPSWPTRTLPNHAAWEWRRYRKF